MIGPVCDDEFGDTYGIVYGFTADGFTHRELRDYVEDIRSRLLQVPDVAKVNLIGAQPERIYIQFSPAKLAGYGLTPTASDGGAAGAEHRGPVRCDHHRRRGDQIARQRRAADPRRTSSPSTSPWANGSSGWPTSLRCGGRTPIRRTRSSASTASPAWACRFPCATVATCSRSAATSSRPCRS